MYLKNKKRCGKYIRSLSLILCLSLMCMPMTGMAYATEVDGDAEPAVDGISDMAEIPEEVLSLETESHMEPTLDSMKEPALEPETTVPVEDPASETSPDPTGENIEPETPAEATETPTVEADYELDVDFPIGWYDEPVTLAIRIDDVNSVGWQKVEAALTDEADAERMDLTEQLEEYGSAEYTVRDNGIVYFFITDSVGVEHTETLNVGFFDFDPPEIRAGIDGAMLHVEAFDECSRMAGIYINDGLYTTLQEAELDIRIDNVKDELFFYIQGEDMLGNLTNYVVLANPFYVEEKTEPIPEPDEDDRHDIHCSEDCDCRKPAAQMGSTGNTGASGGSVPVTQKPVTPEKSAPRKRVRPGMKKSPRTMMRLPLSRLPLKRVNRFPAMAAQ